MGDNRSEASCAVPAFQVGSHGESSTSCGAQGVIAYCKSCFLHTLQTILLTIIGWDGKPYGFNGDAGNWVNNECGC